MTLILALHYRDGLLLASDSQGTMTEPGNPPTKLEIDKLFVLHDVAGWAGSGDTGMIQRVKYRLDKDQEIAQLLREGDAEEIAQGVSSSLNALRREIREESLMSDTAGSPQLDCIFVGFSKGFPFILEIFRDGTRQFHENPYAAIGSGYQFAMHELRSVAHFDIGSLSRGQAEALAFRTVDNAIQTAAHGLGRPVQMLVASRDGAHFLNRSEMKPISEAVEHWKSRDAETLRSLVS